MKKRLLTIFLAGLGLASNAQNVGIGTNTPNASAKLDVVSTNTGVLIPRVALTMTTAAGPVTAPATSLVVYNTATVADVTPGFYYWDGTKWVRFSDKAGWLLTGNLGTNDPAVPVTYGTSTIGAAENWMGTIDANDVVFGTNNVERMRIKQTNGFVGIGTANPLSRVDIAAAARTGTHGSGFPLYVTGTLAPGSAGSVGIEFRHDNGTQGIGFGYNTIYATGSNANQDLGMASRGTGNLLYTTNAVERMRVVGTTGYVGIGTTAPIQNLDVNGRANVNLGVIQRGPTQITATNDLGLYSQVAGNWIRIASNAAPIRFFTDQGGGNSAGTNSIMNIDNANGGGVAITGNTTGATSGTPNARAILDLQSTDKGMLTTRLTTAQRNAMGNVLAEGLLIYNIDNNCYEFWDTKATPAGGNGFWNSLCQWCQNVVVITASQSGYNLNSALGGAKAEHYCVYINAGVTLQAAGNGGGSGAAGNPGFNASTMPAGSSVTLYNYGNILAGGGNGGIGASESDDVCSGNGNSGAGGRGGDAILTNVNVPVDVFNYGIIRAGGGGGGGAGAGCCSAGGGGGGGAGTPAGVGGAGRCYSCTGGFVCGCGNRSGCSGGGAAGTATTAGGGGGGAGSASSGCSGNSNGGTGAAGGVNGVAGSAQGTGCCDGAGCSGAAGGGAGLALQGNNSGSSITNLGGTVTGAVNP